MATIIDGYNVLHVVGILARGVGPGSLHRARLALLNFLAESLEPEEVGRTTVVFDAHDPPPGLPRAMKHRGLAVCFAAEYEDADSQIEELIRRDSAPRRLTVVSSDHRVQRAARRRKARPVDSDQWYADLVRRRRQRRQATSAGSARPPVPLLEEDVNYWIRQFGGRSILEELIEDESAEKPPGSEEPPADQATDQLPGDDKPTPGQAAELDNPFPPGYAEDLLEDEKIDDLYDPFPPGYGEDLQED